VPRSTATSKNKLEVVEALLESVSERMAESGIFNPALANLSSPTRDNVRAHLLWAIEVLQGGRFVRLFQQVAAVSPEIEELRQKNNRSWCRQLRPRWSVAVS